MFAKVIPRKGISGKRGGAKFYVQLYWGKQYRRTHYNDEIQLIYRELADQVDLVSQIFGHTRTDMTKRYRGLNLDKIREME